MADMNDIVKVAVDAYHGNVEKYSVKQSQDMLRQALVEANGGSTTLNYRNIRDGKCAGLFTIVEEILANVVEEGLQGDEFFMNLVETHDVNVGDSPLFLVEDSDLFAVAEMAEGTQGIRRQRLSGVHEVAIPTVLKGVRIYEELNRVLSGRVDFNAMIDRVAKSFRAQTMEDILTLWTTATAVEMGGEEFFPTAGPYDEDELLDVIAHVEAAAGGKNATIIGTKKALRNLVPSIVGSDAKNDLYNLGYFGKFFGSNVIMTPQRHKVGSTQFVLPDNVITIVAGDDKPIKRVHEGSPLIIPGDPLTNADLTMEYLYADRNGYGLVLAGGNSGIGRYEIATN